VVGDAVSFSCEASEPGEGSTIANCVWDFGDGSGSEEMNPGHVYDSAGTFTVTLTVRNAAGVDDTTTASITVVPAAEQLPAETPENGDGG
jgi:PKD repeat protein